LPIRGSAVATIVASIELMNSAMAHVTKIRVRLVAGASRGAPPDPRTLEPPADGFPVSDGAPPNEISAISPLALTCVPRTVVPARRRCTRGCQDLGNKELFACHEAPP
jgi:hypothetical protein